MSLKSQRDYWLVFRYIFLLVTIIFFLFLFFLWRIDNHRAERFRLALLNQIVPNVEFFTTSIKVIGRIVIDISSFTNVYEQNQNLKNELQDMKKWREAAIQLEQKNAKLRALNNLKVNPQLDWVTGEVIADSGGTYSSSALLNVGIEDGIDGLIHISDISWVERIKHPGDCYKKGEELEARILQIDTEGEKFSLGVKQLSEDPWVKVAKTLTPGAKGSGKVTKITDFGVFVELSDGIEGMIHISELDVEQVTDANTVVELEKKIDFIVLSTDAEDRRFSLSRKAYLKGLEGESLKEYIDSVSEPQTAFADAFTQAQESAAGKKKETKEEKVEKTVILMSRSFTIAFLLVDSGRWLQLPPDVPRAPVSECNRADLVSDGGIRGLYCLPGRALPFRK